MDRTEEQRAAVETEAGSREESLRRAAEQLRREAEERRTPVVRPDIRWQAVLGRALLWLIPVAAVFFLAGLWPALRPWRGWAALAGAAVLQAIHLRRTAVSLIRLYQLWAPERVRAGCVFRPTCSNYMLQAIEIHGTLPGIRRGLKRLGRCHPPNGGYDPP